MDHQSLAQLLGNYGEFLGAIAVFVTLFYLAHQVRTNAKMVAIESRQSVLDRFSAVKTNLVSNPHALTAIRKAIDEGATFDTLTN